MRIAIVSGVTKKADSVRGIGVINSELFKIFRRDSNKDIEDPNLNLNDDFSKFDVVHFTVFRPFFISIPFFKPKNTKFVLTIHDLHPLIYPSNFPGGIKGNIRLLINKFLIRKNVDRIITISETSKKDICRLLGVNPSIVTVIYLAAKSAHKVINNKKELETVRKKYNLPKKFIFYFGDINYNKNIGTLVMACKKADIKLVVVGKQAAEIDKMDFNHPEVSHLKGINFSEAIRLGFVSDEDANAILNMALCLVQPSYYEGFGLSVIHAFASGCPVISSSAQALVEIGGNACLYFNPNSVDQLVEKIKDMNRSRELRKKFVKLGFERLKKYNWKKTAEETLDVYAKV